VLRFLSEKGKEFIDNLKKECMVATENKKEYPLKDKVRVDLVYYHKGQGCDRDNIGKGIYDAMEGVIFEDDRQVVAGETLKIKHSDNLLYIIVSPINEKTVENKAKKLIENN
jgi:Holliday junction resolvase RusA-like endonuclease